MQEISFALLMELAHHIHIQRWFDLSPDSRADDLLPQGDDEEGSIPLRLLPFRYRHQLQKTHKDVVTT